MIFIHLFSFTKKNKKQKAKPKNEKFNFLGYFKSGSWSQIALCFLCFVLLWRSQTWLKVSREVKLLIFGLAFTWMFFWFLFMNSFFLTKKTKNKKHKNHKAICDHEPDLKYLKRFNFFFCFLVLFFFLSMHSPSRRT